MAERKPTPVYTISDVLRHGGGKLMGRWKGEQRGVLMRVGASYYGRWREFKINDAGEVRWTQVKRKLCNADEGKAEAIRILNENVAQASGPAACHQGIATLQQFVDARFVPDHVVNLKPNGQRHYAYCLDKHVLLALGKYRLKEFTPSLVQAFLTAKAKTLSGQTVAHLRNVLSAIFRHAKGCGFWRGDLPTEFVRIPEIHPDTPVAISFDDVKAILGNMREPYRTLAHLMVITGLRIGEALALRWDHVDLVKRVVEVRLNFSNGQWCTVKSRNGIRDLPISEELAMALEALRVPGPNGWLVFPNKYGAPLDAHNMSARELKPACKAAKLEPIGWHVLRHTAVTLMRQRGMTGAEAQVFAGHGSAAMTDRYSHAAIERMRAVVDGFKVIDAGGRLM